MAALSSPCTRLCVVDPATAHCRGCGRSLAEIAAWSSLSEPERIAIMAALPHRRAAAARASTAPEPHEAPAPGNGA